MYASVPQGFQVLSSPGFQWIILDCVGTPVLQDLCSRLNRFIQSLGYEVENWSANPIFFIRAGGWVMPIDQQRIRDWLMRQEGCKYVRTLRDKNQRHNTMQLGILHESQEPVELSKLQIY